MTGFDARSPAAWIYWFLKIFTLVQLVGLMFVPLDWVLWAMHLERDWLVHDLGPPAAAWVVRHGTALFEVLVVDTGLRHWADVFLYRPTQPGDAFAGLEVWIVPYIVNRFEIVFIWLATVCQRLFLLLAWLPFLMLLAVPALVDGHMAWRKLRHGFDFSSPILHRWTIEIVKVGVALLAVVLVSPFPVPPGYAPLACLVAAFSIMAIPRTLMKQV